MNLDERAFLQEVGGRVRALREAAGITQATLAERCGLHRTFIGSVERGERNAALLSLRKIAQALRVEVAELLRAEEGDKQPG
jgi:transcriptional regulator with XRE-family HTH domain